MPAFFPIFLNIEGQKCVVVGGGAVAERKVMALLECKASVTLISPETTPALGKLAKAGSIERVARAYRKGDLQGVRLAIAATDDVEVNARVASEARERGVLVNVVDDLLLSEFIVPSVLRRGDVTVAVSTGGKSPALARKIRTDLEQKISSGYGPLATLLAELRTSMKERGTKVNADAWQESLDLAVLLDLVDRGELAEARRRILAGLLANDTESEE